jgi:hypothetical protein
MLRTRLRHLDLHRRPASGDENGATSIDTAEAVSTDALTDTHHPRRLTPDMRHREAAPVRHHHGSDQLNGCRRGLHLFIGWSLGLHFAREPEPFCGTASLRPKGIGFHSKIAVR